MELTEQRVYDIRPAEVVALDNDDENTASIWFADRKSHEVRYVALSKNLPHGSFHTERDDQKWSSRDGVTSVALQDGRLSIQYDGAAARRLGGVELIRIDCQGMNEETLERIEQALRAMFVGSGVPVTIT
jgi:hypothetical protein